MIRIPNLNVVIPTGLYSRGGTNFRMGLRESISIFEKSSAHKKIIFMLTDGDSYGVPSAEELLHFAKFQKVDVFVSGLKEVLEVKLREYLGRRILYIEDIKQLSEEEIKIALQKL